MLKLERPLISLDLETTGRDIEYDQIIQIVMIRVNVDGSKDVYEKKVKPEKPIHPEAEEKHGISMDMLKGCPDFSEVAQEVLDFVEGCDFTGYNIISFDFPLLKYELNRVGLDISPKKHRLFDTYRTVRKLFSWRLEHVYQMLTGKKLEGAHDALPDAEAALEIAQLFVKDHEDQMGSDMSSWESFGWDRKNHVDWGYRFYKEDGVVKFAFGKHKDRPVLEHKSYLEWMLGQDFPEETKAWCRKFINT